MQIIFDEDTLPRLLSIRGDSTYIYFTKMECNHEILRKGHKIKVRFHKIGTKEKIYEISNWLREEGEGLALLIPRKDAEEWDLDNETIIQLNRIELVEKSGSLLDL